MATYKGPHCPVCSKEVPSISSIFLHLKLCHMHEVLQSWQCKEPGCFLDFVTKKSFVKHLVDRHRFVNNKRSTFNQKISDVPEDVSADTNNDFMLQDDVSDQAVPLALTPAEITNNLHSSLLAFVGKLYAAPNLPRNHVQMIVEETRNLVHEILSMLNPVILKASEEKNEENVFPYFLETLNSAVLSPFASLFTEYRRLKFFTTSGFLIKPKTYTVGDVVVNRREDGRILKRIIPVTAQFIPLRKTLSTFFSLPNIFESIMEYTTKLERNNDLICNFIQGDYWQSKKHRFFQGKMVFPLFVYYDDFEVNDPLGTHKNFQNLGATYVSIPCLPPEFQSLLENILLALLCHAHDRKNFTNSKVFHILVDELNYLQKHGIEINTKSGKQRIYFSLAGVLGDNKGLNEVLGFAGGFSANYYCRWCKVHRNQCQVDCYERPELLRDIASYEDDVESGLTAAGINESSVWNKVENFHVYDNCIADIMHDGPEGAFSYDMGHITYHVVYKAAKKVELEILNDRLTCFDFRKCGFSNRPPPIKEADLKNKALKMSASEMMAYIYAFPFLVGDLTSHDDVWRFFLILRRIVDIVMAPALSRECASLLEVYVAEHHELYVKLFDDTLKPKHHFMLHYARVLKSCGPLISLSSFKFESKNRVMKTRAAATCSRVDISFTLALKEQLQFCYRTVSDKGFSYRLELGPSTLVESMTDIKDTCNLSKVAFPPEFTSACLEVPWLKFKGTRYEVGMCLVTDFDDYCNLPVFGEIDRIMCNDSDNVCLLYHEFYTLGLDENLHAFLIHPTGKSKCIMIDNILSPRPVLCVRMPDNNVYAATRYAI